MKTRKNQRLIFWTLCILAALIIPLQFAGEAQAWWNTSWGKRAPVTVSHSGTALSNYQVKVTVTYDSDMKSDFGDIRFVDSDDFTELRYWCETYTASTSAVFWVKVPSIPDGGKAIHMYYKNGSVSTTSSGTNTFEYFEDFEGFSTGSVNSKFGWEAPAPPLTSDPGLIVDNATYSFDGTKYLEHDSATGVGERSSKLDTINLGGDRLIDFRIALIYQGGNGASDSGAGPYSDEGYSISIGTRPNESNTNWLVFYDDGTPHVTDVAFQYNVWVRVQIAASSSGTMNLWIDGTQKYTNVSTGFNDFQGLYFRNDEDAGTRFDQVFIRKYNPPEPTTSVGSEQVAIYYSVGTDSSALYSGNASASSGVLTLASAASNKIGVGDEIRIGTSKRYYITRRNSSTSFNIQDSGYPSGAGTPGDTNITFTTTEITIYRAFNLFSTANGAIAKSLDSDHLETSDLVTGNYQLNWTCYNDGAMNDGYIVIDGWTTSATAYIRIYTPISTSEVGVSQRHYGITGGGFRLAPTYDAGGSSYSVLKIVEDYVRIEGVEIDGSNVSNARNMTGIILDQSLTATSEIRLDRLLIHDLANVDSDTEQGDVFAILVEDGSARISNSFIYDLDGNDDYDSSEIAAIRWQSGTSTGTSYVHNVTIYDVKQNAGNITARGLDVAGGTVTAKNVAVLDVVSTSGSEACFYGTMTQSNNVSSDATATGAQNKTDYSTYFAYITGGSEDLHLKNHSNTLWGISGADLDSDPNLPITEDIDGYPRDASSPDIGADEFGGQFLFRRTITIDHTKVDSTCAEGYPEDFPVLISFSGQTWLKTIGNGGRIYSSNGYDIIFRASNGHTQLSHEVEKYDGSAGTLVAWVKIPALSKTTDTTIYIYYGNPEVTSAPPASLAQGVWSNDYEAVYHLNGNANDSTGNHNGTISGATSTSDGKIAGAYEFNGSNQYINTNLTKNWGCGGFTIEVWWNADDLYRNQEIVGVEETSGAICKIGTTITGNIHRNYIKTEGTNGGSEEDNFQYLSGMSAATWYYTVLVRPYNSDCKSCMQGFLDGSDMGDGCEILWGETNFGDYFNIGRLGGTGIQYFDGKIDDLRFSNVARDACWIKTEYNNQSSPGTFYTLGSEGGTAPTAVNLKSFKALQYGDGVLLKWKTSHEVNNLGFNVYREANGELVRLTPELITGSALLAGSGTPLTAGHHYTWLDDSVLSPQSSSLSSERSAVGGRRSVIRYWLEDVDLTGQRTWHGPVEALLLAPSSPLQASEVRRAELLSEFGARLQEKYADFWKVQDLREKLKKNVTRYTLLGKTKKNNTNDDSRIKNGQHPLPHPPPSRGREGVGGPQHSALSGPRSAVRRRRS